MRHLVRWCVLAAIVLAPAWASGQSFSAHGSQRTDPFALAPGVAVFSIDHIGEGAFRVELLDREGAMVGEVVSATGPFSGTQAVRVEQAGEYRFRVSATGTWSIQRRSEGRSEAGGAEPQAASPVVQGRAAGAAAAPGAWQWGWFARGLAGGTVAGPLGAGFVVVRARSSEADPPPPEVRLPDADARYAAAFREEYAARLRARRTEAAAVGSLIGTGVFLYVLLQVLDFDLGGGQPGTPPPLPPAT